MRAALVVLGLLLAVVAVGAEPEQPAPAPTPPAQTLKLNLDGLLDFQQERGHAEFDLGLRREIWSDPMVRLAMGLAREEAAATRGGLVGADRGPWTATSLLMNMPGADPRLILSGPFARDWHELTTQEKIGRISEGVVYWGLIIGIVSSLHRP